MRDRHHILVAATAAAASIYEPRVADACGCLSPPAVTEGQYAVNQRAEQIIFEVDPPFVTAHVLIKYAGAPEQFAWIIPAPELPELGISPVSAFGMIDQLTNPDVSVNVQDICPLSDWECHFKQTQCGFGAAGDDDDGPFGLSDAGANALDAGTNGQPPVTVLDTKVVGDYQTVTFRASEASAAVQWLRDNGFIVNPTTSIYMDPYVQANMVFVAIKLVAGADVSAIKPLRMRYRAQFPMIPLVLTAVAAEPHLTVSAFVYGNAPFKPMGHPIVTIDQSRIAQDASGRVNYPMVLARTIDEAGGDGFAAEYRGAPVRPEFGQNGSGCCDAGFDLCNIGNDSQCQCPRSDFDHADCSTVGDILDGVALVDSLATKHSNLTRLTTRVSPEEMNFDPTFEPDFNASLQGKLVAHGDQISLANCAAQVIDKDQFAELQTTQGCAAMYCGTGQCVTTAQGAACACDAETVARRFIDLDGLASVTCIPRVPPVDLRAGGRVLPDACAGVDCGMGACLDRNGVAVCECDGGAAAIASAGTTPRCEPIEHLTQTPGAQDYSEDLRPLAVCAPTPPSCGEGGWLVRRPNPRPGVDCGNTAPAAALTEEPPSPNCGNDGLFGCAGCQQTNAPPIFAIVVTGVVIVLLRRKRRGSR